MTNDVEQGAVRHPARDTHLTARLAFSLLALFLVAPVLSAGTISFGPTTVAGNSVIFDPDNVLTSSELAVLGSNGSLGAMPAVEALSFGAAAGQTFTFSASGLVGCCGTANVGPDGYLAKGSKITSLGSISGFVAPAQLPLVGVFTEGPPSGPAPASFDYSGGLGQSSFSPLLDQVFFIGDGLTGRGSGSLQTFNVPAGATELWLGFADAYGFIGAPGYYGDNPGCLAVSGTLTTGVSPVPEPGTLALIGSGLLIGLRRRSKQLSS